MQFNPGFWNDLFSLFKDNAVASFTLITPAGRSCISKQHQGDTVFNRCFLLGIKPVKVGGTISNSFKSSSRGICVWAFCYWYFCKRRTSSHGAPHAILLDGVQAELHQYGLPSPPPVHKQWEHLYWGPGSDRKGSEIFSFQTRCPERLLRLICHGECASLAVSPKWSCGWDVCLSALLTPMLSSLSLLVVFKVLLQSVSPVWYHALPPPCQRILVLDGRLIINESNLPTLLKEKLRSWEIAKNTQLELAPRLLALCLGFSHGPQQHSAKVLVGFRMTQTPHTCLQICRCGP